MELKDVKMIDILLKLKYRKINKDTIITRNGDFTIEIKYIKIPKCTEITICENVSDYFLYPNDKDDRYDTVHYQCVEGNLIPIFTVVSDEDYIRNRLKVEI